ncbi:alpha-2B adrenergic receptor-like [Paramacrobiotus metropolitanus]|uniref:alpha-2B adrenergic receptor-like n=1 Tax=Paramacrobiotus metropolitanus TaxID=2943436 RepID=UPI0024463CEA|nr:alpha-2B adrenergic receptor-like [Paramacrobiotus metropolitanus]
MAVLIFHAVFPSHITPFTIYLLAIFASNVVHLSVVRTLGIVNDLRGMWPFGRAECMLFLYFEKVISIIPVMTHVLISVNRLWAVVYPVSYREHHTKTMATLICLGVVAYANILDLPPFLLDRLRYYNWDKSKGCPEITGTFILWTQIETFLNRFLPLLFIIVAYIFLIIKRWQKKKKLQPGEKRDKPRKNTDAKALPSAQNVCRIRMASCRKQNRSRDKQPHNVKNNLPVRTVRPFMILTLTCISVLICWIPVDVYFLAMKFNARMSQTVFIVTGTLFSVQMIFDPLVWLVSLRKTKS